MSFSLCQGVARITENNQQCEKQKNKKNLKKSHEELARGIVLNAINQAIQHLRSYQKYDERSPIDLGEFGFERSFSCLGGNNQTTLNISSNVPVYSEPHSLESYQEQEYDEKRPIDLGEFGFERSSSNLCPNKR